MFRLPQTLLTTCLLFGITTALGEIPTTYAQSPLAAMTAEEYYHQGVFKDQLEGDKQGAIEYYTQAIKLDPNHTDAYNDRGLARLALGDPQGAIADYTQAIKINPRHAQIYNNRGTARLAVQDLQGAIADYTQAIKINPLLEDSYLHLAQLYRQSGLNRENSGDVTGAIAEYTQAIQVLNQMPSSERSRLRGNRQGSVYNLAMTHYHRGLSRYNSGDKQGAINDLQKAAELFHTQADTNNHQLAVRKIREIQR
ncbi:tetratricopeptide repeat protein [Gloeocapsa sp. BRSZ]